MKKSGPAAFSAQDRAMAETGHDSAHSGAVYEAVSANQSEGGPSSRGRVMSTGLKT